jgi:hypothetical protein
MNKVFRTKNIFAFPSTDPPEITVDNPIVYSGEGQEAMLVCIVHGESQPEVGPKNDSYIQTLKLKLKKNL